MKTEPQLLQIDPKKLTVHPVAKAMPERPLKDERFIALVADMEDRGIDQAILVDPERRILDGRDRWRAALLLELPAVPIIVREEGECLAVILQSLVQRKHYTKGALAYVAFPLLEPAFEESLKKRRSNLKIGKNPNVSPKQIESSSGKTIADFAAEMGICHDLFSQAKKVHKIFAASDAALPDWDKAHPEGGEDRPDIRAKFEPKILAGEIGLGAALAGIGGFIATKDQPRADQTQLELFKDGAETLKTRIQYFKKMTEEQQEEAYLKVVSALAEFPSDWRARMARDLSGKRK